jgi:hypothetical protein
MPVKDAHKDAESPQPPEAQDGPGDGRSMDKVLDAAARQGRGDKVSPEDQPTQQEQADALDWFLADADDTDLTHTFQMNVGSIKDKHWIDWTVQPVDMDRLRRIRRSSQQGSRRARITGSQDFDEIAANVQVVLEGTVRPDLRDAAKRMGIVDPGIAVRTRFAHKPGLLAQIAGEIMSISGYDDDDVREVDAARG